MSDQGPQGREPTEEEVRAYLAQLRQADPAEIVAQAFSMLASGAEVKLGRRDARLLIDLAGAVAEQASGRLDEQLTGQMDQAVTQLRTAQVDAEGQLAQLREEGKLPDEEEGDLPEEGAPPPRPAAGSDPAAPPTQARPPQQPPSKTSRLWVPGT